MSELGKTEIARLLPHGSSMCLIDEVISFDENKILCKTFSQINPKNPLAVDGRLPLMAYLEYAAQAAGLHLGLSQNKSRSNAPTAGYVGTLKNIQFTSFDPITEELYISANVLIKEDKNAIYHFVIKASTSVIVEGRISLSHN